MADESTELVPIRGRLYVASEYRPGGPVSAAVSEWTTLRPTDDDPRYSHAGTAVCQRCEAVVTIRLPRATDFRARLARDRASVMRTIPLPLGLVLGAIFLLIDPLGFNQDGLVVLAVFVGMFAAIALVVAPTSAIWRSATKSPLICDHELGKSRQCGHFAW